DINAVQDREHGVRAIDAFRVRPAQLRVDVLKSRLSLRERVKSRDLGELRFKPRVIPWVFDVDVLSERSDQLVHEHARGRRKSERGGEIDAFTDHGDSFRYTVVHGTTTRYLTDSNPLRGVPEGAVLRPG